MAVPVWLLVLALWHIEYWIEYLVYTLNEQRETFYIIFHVHVSFGVARFALLFMTTLTTRMTEFVVI